MYDWGRMTCIPTYYKHEISKTQFYYLVVFLYKSQFVRLDINKTPMWDCFIVYEI